MDFEKAKNDADKIDFSGTEEEMIRCLNSYRVLGYNVYCEIEDLKFYSQDPRGKQGWENDFENMRKQAIQTYEEKKNPTNKGDIQKAILLYGMQFVDDSKKVKWQQRCEKVMNSLYGEHYAKDLILLLNVLETVPGEKGLSIAQDIINSQNHTGASWGMMMTDVLEFSKRGYEFAMKVDPEILKNSQLNNHFEKIKSNNSTLQDNIHTL